VVARIAAVLGGPRRALALAGLTAAIAAYTAGADHLWRASLWPDILFIALVLIPATLVLVLMLLPVAFMPRLLPVIAALAVVAVGAGLADLDVLFNLAKFFALVLLGFWFLSYFENVAWAALVAVIIPWVDIWSVFFGPTGKITSDHPSVFEHISIAFRVPGGHSTANLGPPDILFFALFVAAARRFGLRTGWTWFAMTALTACTLILSVKAHRGGLPALPAIAFGFLLANADLLWHALRRRGRAPVHIYSRAGVYDLEADVIERMPAKIVLLTRDHPPVTATIEPVRSEDRFPVEQSDAVGAEILCRLTIGGADAGEALVHDLPNGLVIEPREPSPISLNDAHPEQLAADEAKVERLRRERS
jgi:hypothetical protein